MFSLRVFNLGPYFFTFITGKKSKAWYISFISLHWCSTTPPRNTSSFFPADIFGVILRRNTFCIKKRFFFSLFTIRRNGSEYQFHSRKICFFCNSNLRYAYAYYAVSIKKMSLASVVKFLIRFFEEWSSCGYLLESGKKEYTWKSSKN